MATQTFIFQTGHAKGLAKAEIKALLGEVIIDEVQDGFVLELEMENRETGFPANLLQRMGSVVRMTEVLQSGPARMPLNFEEWVVNAVSELKTKDMLRKYKFGLSMHPKSDKILKKILTKSKRHLKESLGSLRFINKDFQNVTTVQASSENLTRLPHAIDLHLFKSVHDDKAKWYLSKSIAIHDFSWYSTRDYDRPARSAKNGMMPPKLSQILINLAVADETKPSTHFSKDAHIIYDPFCGSGTILQEAMLMGYRGLGSDLSEQMVSDSRENLKWLDSNIEELTSWCDVTSTEDRIPQVFHADATKLTADQIPQTEFSIVTETWLGPALEKPLTPLERPKVHREIEALYEDFFSNLSKVIKRPVMMVFTAPYHKEKNDRHFLLQLPKILEQYTEIIPLSDHERPSLFYERKQQLVGREIWKVKVLPV